jgi:transposase
MAKTLVTNELWERIKDLLPEPFIPGAKGGRPGADNRVVLEGILFVLKTGIRWQDLPAQFEVSGMTCWRRLRLWQRLGVWQALHLRLLEELRQADKLDFRRASVDSSFVRAIGGGEQTGPNPTDRRKLGSKHHLLVDAHGIPLAVVVTAANRPDVLEIISLVVEIPEVGGKPGRPRQRPDKLYADRAYDSEPVRRILRWLGITPWIARRHTAHGSGLGVYRYVVERTLGWLHNFRRLRIRYDRQVMMQTAFLQVACCLICLRQLLA